PVRRPLTANTNTRTAAAIPLATAESAVSSGPALSNMICAIAPVAAPVVKPITSGEPRALREIDWKIEPAMPSEAPTNKAVTRRGKRTRWIMQSAVALSLPPRRLETTWEELNDIVPVAIWKTASNRMTASKRQQIINWRDFQRTETEPIPNLVVEQI